MRRFKLMLPSWKKTAFVPLVVVGMAIALILLTPARTPAQEVIRYPIPNSTFPIALAVETPPSAALVHLSGQVPPVVDETAEEGTIAAYGDTTTQTIGVLERIQTILQSLDMTMADVIKMQVFLVGDPDNGGVMDFDGFMEGYTQFFGTEAQPNLPARSTMQVAGLVDPGWLVEIEVVAVRPPA
jgi:enamine deaminase RidA (YjgF/YER057c/UK114 family)